MKLSQKLFDRSLVTQLTWHGNKVKKLAQSGQLVGMGVRPSGTPSRLFEAKEGNGFVWAPIIACTNIRYVPRSSLRLVVFFHYSILLESFVASLA